MSFEFTGAYQTPGINAALETVEKQIWWDRWESCVWVPALINGATRDTGNTGYTDVLRPGLAMGQITATGKLIQWDPTATDGSEKLFGFLGHSVKMQRLGSNQDRFVGWIMVAGRVKQDNILIYGQTTYGIVGQTYEFLLRSWMRHRFLAMGGSTLPNSDWLAGNAFGFNDIIAKTASYTVLTTDNNTLFTTKGASGTITFTTPTTAYKGLHYGFYNAADQTMTVTAGTADTMVAINDLAADSVSFATASSKIGGMIEIYGDGSLWLTRVSPGQTSDGTTSGQLVTVAT